MTVKIKPKRGSGSPAGSIETNEIAMDTAAKKLYVSTDGSNAVVLADDTKTYLETDITFFSNFDSSNPPKPGTVTIGANTLSVGGGGQRLQIASGTGGIRLDSITSLNNVALRSTGGNLELHPVDEAVSYTHLTLPTTVQV